MNDKIDFDFSKKPMKKFARAKTIKKKPSVSNGRNAGQSGRPGDIYQGFKLKIRPIWLIVFVIIILGFLFFDFKGEGNLKVSSHKNGSIPIIKGIHITPETPNRNNDLLANVIMKGKTHKETSLKYRWYKNDNEITGVQGRQLSHNHFTKGDVIKVAVIPVENATEGKPLTSSIVRIQNCPPIIHSVFIQPQIVYTNTDITVDVHATDPDEELISFNYQWIKNGIEIQGEFSEHLDHSNFVKGDQIQVSVSPFDRYDHGISMLSSVVVVNNSPPQIISQPPSTLNENGIFAYKVLAKDIDDDPLTFSLSANNPPGITIDSKTGSLLWNIPNDIKHLANRIEIIVRDNDRSETSQWFTLHIQFTENQHSG